jgi:hypothetical protein
LHLLPCISVAYRRLEPTTPLINSLQRSEQVDNPEPQPRATASGTQADAALFVNESTHGGHRGFLAVAHVALVIYLV